MIARSAKGKLLVFAVFFIGIATGIMITDFYQTRVAGNAAAAADAAQPAANGQRDVKKVHDYLGLDEQQRKGVDAILEDGRNQIRALRMETQPKFQAIEDNTQAKIRAILNPDQLKKYEEFRQQIQERRNRERSRRGGPAQQNPNQNQK